MDKNIIRHPIKSFIEFEKVIVKKLTKHLNLHDQYHKWNDIIKKDASKNKENKKYSYSQPDFHDCL